MCNVCPREEEKKKKKGNGESVAISKIVTAIFTILFLI